MGHLGQGIIFCLLKKTPGTPGFAVLSNSTFRGSPYISRGLYTRVYTCNTFSEPAYCRPIPLTAAAQVSLQDTTCKAPSCANKPLLCFYQRHKSNLTRQAAGMGQCFSFHTFIVSTCFISIVYYLILQPQVFCPRLL